MIARPSRATARWLPRRALLTCCTLTTIALPSSACGPIVGPAAFRSRPDAAERGRPLGPFHGRVVDAETGRPIERALVLCSWSFVRGVGAVAPEASRAFRGETDLDGVYRIPELEALPGGLSTRLARTTLLIYHPDYVAYRSDFTFAPRLHRRDFAQRGNLVRLSRFGSELSHARHLLFFGGDAEIRGAARRERSRAAMELDQPALSATTRPGEVAATQTQAAPEARAPAWAELLLAIEDVQAVTGYRGTFKQQRLTDAGDATDTLHLQAEGQGERYDVALRLWRRSPDDLVAKLEGLREELPGSRPLSGLADRALTVAQDDIRGIAFLDAGHAALVLLTCGRAQCRSAAQALALARRAAARLSRLPRWDATPPAASDTPPAEEP